MLPLKISFSFWLGWNLMYLDYSLGSDTPCQMVTSGGTASVDLQSLCEKFNVDSSTVEQDSMTTCCPSQLPSSVLSTSPTSSLTHVVDFGQGHPPTPTPTPTTALHLLPTPAAKHPKDMQTDTDTDPAAHTSSGLIVSPKVIIGTCIITLAAAVLAVFLLGVTVHVLHNRCIKRRMLPIEAKSSSPPSVLSFGNPTYQPADANENNSNLH